MKLEGIYITREKGSFVTTPEQETTLLFSGIEGDRHYGNTKRAGVRERSYKNDEIFNYRQISIVSTEELEAIAKALEVPEVKPEWLGANLLVSGYDSLTQIAPTTQLRFPSRASIMIYGENKPCIHPGKKIAEAYHNPLLASKFVKAAHKRRGLIGWIFCEGVISVGDEVQTQMKL